MRLKLGLATVIGTALIAAQAPAMAQDLSKIRYLAANCANCHGTDGNSVGGMVSLAGYDRAAFIKNMNAFRSGERPATLMHQLAKGYSDQQIADLAAYFSAQKKK
ncbi:MAG: c-type cytochrome [Burkholderiaceae bacterium]|jgi:cytochrome c553